MMKSCLEQLLELRPINNEPGTIEDSIEKLRLKRAAFALDLKAAQEKRRGSMLMAPIQQLKAIDELIVELGRAEPQAEELISTLTAHLAERKKCIAEQNARRLVSEVEAAFLDLEHRFLAFYAPLASKFSEFAAEHQALRAKQNAADAAVLQFHRKYGPVGLVTGQPVPKELPPRVSDQLTSIFFDKIALPDPAITLKNTTHTPMVHKGDFWKPERDEGPPPEFFERLAKDAEQRRLQRKANEESRARAPDADGYESRNLYAYPGGR